MPDPGPPGADAGGSVGKHVVVVKPGRTRIGAMVAIGVVVMAVLAWAWADGGREPLREIAVPVAVPEAAR